MSGDSLSNDFFFNIIKESVSAELNDLKSIELAILGFAIQTVARYRSQSCSQKYRHGVNYQYGVLCPDVVNDCLRELIISFSESNHSREWMSLLWAVSCNTISANDIIVLLQNDPNSVRTVCSLGPSRNSILPIHLLCASSNPSVDIADILIAAFPFSVMQATLDGFLPLHYAARYCSSVVFVKFILQANDKAIRQKTRRMATCLHLAVLNPCQAVFTCILEAFPDALNEVMRAETGSDFSGTPLHLAIKCGNLFAVKAILQASPDLCRQPFEDAQVHPLHYAALNSSLDVVDAVLSFDRDMLSVPSGIFHSHVLHYAVDNEDDAVLEYILHRCYPNNDTSVEESERYALNQREGIDPLVDARGRHIIHALIKSSHVTARRIDLLLAKFPTVLAMRDRDRNLPLHILFDSMSQRDFRSSVANPSLPLKQHSVFEFVLSKYPQATAERNSRNNLPLHRFASAADSLIGFPSSGGSGSPSRKKRYDFPCGIIVDMLRQLLKYTVRYADDTALASLTIEDENVYDLITRHCTAAEHQHGAGGGGGGGGVRSVCGEMATAVHEENCGMSARREMERLLLRACPDFDDRLLRALNYEARRMALFLAFSAGTLDSRHVNIFARLRKVGQGEMLSYVVGFL